MTAPFRIAAVLGLGFAAMAQAQDFDAAPYATVKGWQVDTLTDSAGFLACAGASEQPDGFLILMHTRDDEWVLRVPTSQTEGFEGAIITVDDHEIDAQFGFKPEGAGEGTIDDSTLALIHNGAALKIAIHGEKATNWVLTGSGAVIGKITECAAHKGIKP